ncbi:MAG: PEP-CTERM sorting domain-containing protein [Planctomycetes bacterium]|nr:PEP-CTERM sorting domain-containing protein [Planctomycetota bacterium]
MMHKGPSLRGASRLFLLAACVAGLCGWAQASPIGPGYDFLETLPGTYFDLGPGIGPINLTGQPLGLPGLGTTDTIVRRPPDPVFPLPPGGTGVVPIEIVALNLVSVNPITIGPTQYDVSVRSMPSPPGTMSITTHADPGGGTFNSILPVQAIVTFTEVGNPLNWFQQPFTEDFQEIPPWPWSHAAPFDYPNDPSFPSGNFIPGVDPGTGNRTPFWELGQSTGSEWFVTPARVTGAIPEPGTLCLVGLGLAMFVRRRRSG